MFIWRMVLRYSYAGLILRAYFFLRLPALQLGRPVCPKIQSNAFFANRKCRLEFITSFLLGQCSEGDGHPELNVIQKDFC